MSALTGPAGGSALTEGYTPAKKEDTTAQDPRVFTAQQALLSKGYKLEKDAPNGILGPATSAALKSFQSTNGIEPTGEPDEQTLAILARKDDAQVMYGGANA